MLQSSEKKLMAINLIDEENKRQCNCKLQTASLLFHGDHSIHYEMHESWRIVETLRYNRHQ